VTAPVVTSRRITAGIHPGPGATSRLPAWWSADDWLDEVKEALTVEVCAEFSVAPDTALAVARRMAEHADYRTGRDCRPTNERLVELAQVSLSTVQRARRALKRLGLVVELVRGRSILSRAERLAAWRRGSSHRQVAAEFALCSRRERPRSADVREGSTVSVPGGVTPSTVVHNRRRRAQSVDGDTPPGSEKVDPSLTSRSSLVGRKAETSEEEAAPRLAPTSKGRRRAGHDPAARRLAERARARLGWLAAVSAARLTPTLHRFARAGWTAKDVERAVADSLATRGWRVPRELTQPAAYLAALLREVDPADRPGALDEHMAAVEAAQAAYERRLIHGAPCEHGQPAGDVPSPLRGNLACPACRRAAAR
jgi:hypothetical protein